MSNEIIASCCPVAGVHIKMYKGIGAHYIYILVQIISGSLIAVGVCLQMWEEHPDVYGVRRSNRSRQEPARLNIGAGVSRRTKKP